jgi:hypothetical protein
MGKDVAETTVTTKIEGLLLDSEQLVDNGDDFLSGWTLNLATGSVSNGIYSFTATERYGSIRHNVSVISGNKYYIVSRFKADGDVRPSLNGVTGDMPFHSGSGNYEMISGVQIAGDLTSRFDVYDNRTSGWTQIDVDYAYVFNISTLISNKQYSPLYSTTFDLMSDAQIKAQMDLWVANKTLPNSIMSVDMDKRVTSVGKNLFYGELELGALDVTTGQETVNTSRTRSLNYIKIKPNTDYKLSSPQFDMTIGVIAESDIRIYYYDVNYNFISQIYVFSVGSSFTTPKNAHYIRFMNAGSNNLNDDYQLEVGTVATTYELFRKSSMYLDSGEVGYSLPNSTKDTIEFRNGQAYYIQRVKKYTLQASDIVGLTAMTNNTRYFTNTPYMSDAKLPLNDSLAEGTYYAEGFVEIPLTNRDTTAQSYKTYLSITGQLNFIFANGTYASLAEAQADLVGTDIYYQLATPIETPISVIGNAMAYPNGTFLIEDVVRRSGVYSSGITVDKPIKKHDNIYKLNDDGSSTKLAVSGATVAGDGLSFTHTSLSNGDFVWFDYYYQGTNIKGLSTVYYYGDRLIGADVSDGKTYKAVPVFTNGVVTWVSVEV